MIKDFAFYKPDSKAAIHFEVAEEMQSLLCYFGQGAGWRCKNTALEEEKGNNYVQEHSVLEFLKTKIYSLLQGQCKQIS